MRNWWILAIMVYLFIGGILWYESFWRTMAVFEERAKKEGRELRLQPGLVSRSVGMFWLGWPAVLVRKWARKLKKH